MITLVLVLRHLIENCSTEEVQHWKNKFNEVVALSELRISLTFPVATAVHDI